MDTTSELDPVVSVFMQNSFLDREVTNFKKAFTAIKSIYEEYYEDNFIELVVDNNITNDDKIDRFHLLLISEFIDVLKLHGITLDRNHVYLKDLVPIVEALILVQNLEDYTHLSYVLSADTPSKTTLIRVLLPYVALPEFILMELIDTVDDTFILNLKKLVEANLVVTPIVNVCLPYIKAFKAFTSDVKCLGDVMYTANIYNLEVDDLPLVLEVDIPSTIKETLSTNKGQAVTDILSLLIQCVDAYKTPIETFKEKYQVFLENEEDVLNVEPMLRKLSMDFTEFLKHQKL